MRANSINLFVACAFYFFGSLAFGFLSSTSTDVSSTTSGSVKKIFAQNDQDRLNQFVEQNFSRLQEDAARGAGVLLTDYVSLIGCSNPNDRVSHLVQKNYSRLFNDGKTQLIHKTQELIQSDSELVRACEARS